MKTSTKIIIAVVILAVIGVAIYFGSEKYRKERLVDKIFEKNANNPLFDADREKLMQLDIATLKAYLDGTIK